MEQKLLNALWTSSYLQNSQDRDNAKTEFINKRLED